jgi:hypothetical protein
MSVRSLLLVASAALMPLALAACQGQDQTGRAGSADAQNAADPAVTGAVGDGITVDQQLTGQANANAATAGARPVDGAVPVARGGGTAAEAVADARRIVGGQMLSTPAAGRFDESCDGRCPQSAAAQPRAETLGGVARQQAGERCGPDIRYGADWARRLPAAFPLYPRAALVEAAGVANGRCNVRVVNFQSRAGLQAVLDFYYTQARRNGYDAEHVLRGSEHYLGGTKGEDAFVVMARPMAGGLVDVDLVVTGGQ